jgi:hypothetical protein
MGWQGSFHLLLGIDCKELPVPVHVTAKCPFVFGHCLSRSSRSVSFRTVSPGCLLRNAYSFTLFSNRLLKSPERLDHSSGVSMFKLLKFGHSWWARFCVAKLEKMPRVENDSYVIYKNLYVRIRRLRLILYHRFFKRGMGGIHRWYG